MDEYTIKTAIVIGSLIVIGVLWLVWKFFFRLFKLVVIALLIGGIGAAIYYYRSSPPPYIGKHAYLIASGTYLGVVERQENDKARGEVWVVRQPDGHQAMHSKTRVTLKDERDLELEQRSQPVETPTPGATNKPRRKG